MKANATTAPNSDAAARHWRANLRATAVLLLLWFFVTFVASYYANELNHWQVLGFPLGFYMGAQGAPVVYLLIVVVYAWFMRRLDRRYGLDQGEN